MDIMADMPDKCIDLAICDPPYLTVAHLDHDKRNNRLKNLRALCQRCHLRYDIKRHVRNRAQNKLKNEILNGQLGLFE